MHTITLIARALDLNGVDPNNLDLNTTDPVKIAMQRKYCRPGLCPGEWATIAYRPSPAGNSIYLICFAALLAAQLYFGIRTKTWKFLGAFSMGILLEIIGYIGRLMLWKNNFIMNNFLVNLIPLTIAPALIAAGIYLSLGRVIVAIGSDYSRLRPTMYTIVFVSFDLLALVLQAIGGGLAATAKDSKGSRQGVDIMIAGLVSQVVTMAIFFAVWGDFAFRVHRARLSGALSRTEPPLYSSLRATRNFKYFQWSLFAATILIFGRCVYRVVELWEGFSGHLANDEATFMIFEGPLIILAVLSLTIFHPGRVFGDLWISAGKGVGTLKSGASNSTADLVSEEYKGSTASEGV